MYGIHEPDFIIKIREQNVWLNYYIKSVKFYFLKFEGKLRDIYFGKIIHEKIR